MANMIMRFPGGCAADHFQWKESLKAPEFRKPVGAGDKWFLFRDTYDQDCLDIGINEFMMLCRELGAEPEYTVSLLLSDADDARRLVEYCNGGADTAGSSSTSSQNDIEIYSGNSQNSNSIAWTDPTTGQGYDMYGNPVYSSGGGSSSSAQIAWTDPTTGQGYDMYGNPVYQ